MSSPSFAAGSLFSPLNFFVIIGESEASRAMEPKPSHVLHDAPPGAAAANPVAVGAALGGTWALGKPHGWTHPAHPMHPWPMPPSRRKAAQAPWQN